jgi:hypothetical protein
VVSLLEGFVLRALLVFCAQAGWDARVQVLSLHPPFLLPPPAAPCAGRGCRAARLGEKRSCMGDHGGDLRSETV